MELFMEILKFWTPFTALAVILFSWGVTKIISKRLYDDKGITIFVPRTECKDDRHVCTSNICTKLDAVHESQKEIKMIINKNEEKGDASREVWSTKLDALSNTVHGLEGRFDQYQKDRLNVETR